MATDKDRRREHQIPKPDRPYPRSLRTSISPPSRVRRKHSTAISDRNKQARSTPHEVAHIPSVAAIEAGEAQVKDHFEHFSHRLSHHTKPNATLSHHAFKQLYRRSQQPCGRHFVIHQHDHPVAGVHYDLRLQINETSSISWAIMYGLPGNPNSRRLNRNATETRVHNIWVDESRNTSLDEACSFKFRALQSLTVEA